LSLDAAQVAAILTSTGISDTVASYTYPKCSKHQGGIRQRDSGEISRVGFWSLRQ